MVLGRDTPSSGERKGKSPNPTHQKALRSRRIRELLKRISVSAVSARSRQNIGFAKIRMFFGVAGVVRCERPPHFQCGGEELPNVSIAEAAGKQRPRG